jgi:LysR family transcriptional activator of nhaA
LIRDQPVSLIGDFDYPEDSRELADILAEEPLIVPTVASNIRIAFDALIERLQVHPRIQAEVNDMTMLRVIAREKTGLAVVPPIVVKDELDQQVLREVRKVPDIRETFYAVVLKRQFPSPLLAKLIGRHGRRGT